MKLGLKRLSEDFPAVLNGPIGLLAHKASIVPGGKHIFDLLKNAGADINAIFGPEHGFETSSQDMEAVSHVQKIPPFPPLTKGGVKPRWGNAPLRDEGGFPIYSLYGKTFESLKPTPKMFKGIDTLVVDLQDIGARYYTYIYTMAFCMQTAARTGAKVVVCDRPNPINGIDIEGSLIEKGYESFVGLYPLPVRHGMTIGELANLFNKEFDIGCELKIIKMEGWKRGWRWEETGLDWVNPSPNMRSPDAALLYPGMCLIEGTNISEGRGTETPFELCGAPFINGKTLAKKMSAMDLPGIEFHPVEFTPTMQKWKSKKCNGVKFEITDKKIFRPYLTGMALIYNLATFSGFKWRTEEYEFRTDVPAIDLLTGSSDLRNAVDASIPFEKIKDKLTTTPLNFQKTRQKYLLY